MWRYLLIVLLSAAMGSLGATALFAAVMGGTGAADPVRFVFAFALFTMMFTIPGAMMLVGLRAIVAERGLGRLPSGALVALFGALSGAAILAVILNNPALGALYGFSTAVSLMLVQRLVEAPDRAPA